MAEKTMREIINEGIDKYQTPQGDPLTQAGSAVNKLQTFDKNVKQKLDAGMDTVQRVGTKLYQKGKDLISGNDVKKGLK